MFKEKYEEFRKNNPKRDKLKQGIFFKECIDMGIERKEITQTLIEVDDSTQGSAKSIITQSLKKAKELEYEQAPCDSSSEVSSTIIPNVEVTLESDTEEEKMSNAVIISQPTNLPTNMSDLSKYVLIGRDKLNAVKAEIAAIQKLDVAKELCDQKRAEAQDLAEIVTYAEMKLGDLFSKIPKASGGNHGNQYTTGKNGSQDNFANSEDPLTDSDTCKSKSEIIAELGFSAKQVSQFQIMAKYPDIVDQSIEEARSKGDIISRKQVLSFIKRTNKKPPINSENSTSFLIESAKILGIAVKKVTAFIVDGELISEKELRSRIQTMGS